MAQLEISRDTFYRWLKEDALFSDTIKSARESGKASLRRIQYDLAKKGNAAMAIWLGKQYLGQRDNIEVGNVEGKSFKLKYSVDKDE